MAKLLPCPQPTLAYQTTEARIERLLEALAGDRGVVTIENEQAIAAYESPRPTKLHDRTSDDVTLDEVERIAT
jgi:hypothetical protein